MGRFEEGLRLFWLRGIQNVVGATRQGLAEWITKGDFLVTNVSGPTDFTIQMLDVPGGMKSIAHDSSRMAAAAFETMIGIDVVAGLPKSTAWILIRGYYAAFFAAHSLLRMLGTACVQLGTSETTAIDRVAQALGMLPDNGFENGFYVARFEPSSPLKKSLE